LDGSLSNFDVNMELHYQICRNYKPDAHLIGSNTILTGIELYGGSPQETSDDFKKPIREKTLPYWIIIDTKAKLNYKLHEIRRFEFCKDIIILISEKTQKKYIHYLTERDYDFQIIGNNTVNISKALDLLYDKYNIKKLVTDSGKILGNILLNKGLVDEISLLVHPIIVGTNAYTIFDHIITTLQLKLVKNVILKEGYIWSVYSCKN
jgi:2,5-diamino-6-(ribosylamino)-4(3H)-pyrimidinone 5'-phosphate reductase